MTFTFGLPVGRRSFTWVLLLPWVFLWMVPELRGQDRSVVVVENADLRMEFASEPGLILSHLVNKRTGDDALKTGNPARLFVVTTGRVQVDARDFDGRATAKRRGDRQVVQWSGKCRKLDLTLRFHDAQGALLPRLPRKESDNLHGLQRSRGAR